jgi:D-3-phosphoglycerate dehydrogenase
MTNKIFITGSYIASDAEALMKKNGFIFEFGHESDTPEKIEERLLKFQPDGMIVRKGKITKNVLHASSKLKVVTKHGVGVDNIDIKAATNLGIPVMITTFANFESVAEHTLALIFSLLRKIPQQNTYSKKGNWDKTNYYGHELLEKTLGLVGFGRIGKRLAELVKPLNMKVMVYDPYLKKEMISKEIMVIKNLNELLSEADIVSLHCPLNEDTKGLIGENELNLMKENSWIINTARGAVINESALIQALQDKKLAGAALDTLEKEPPAQNNLLYNMDNVIVTNHIGGVSINSFRNMGIDAVNNILTILKGKMPDLATLVNPEVLNKND